MTALDTRFEQIKRLVEETPRERLEAVASEQDGGIDGVLEGLFQVYQDSFDPERAGNSEAEFLFEIETPEGLKPYALTVAKGVCKVRPGTLDAPTASIKLGLADFLQMSLGRTSGGVLAMAGRLQVEGDVFAAISFGDWFVPPWDEE
jgi:hypothetical protein